MALNQPFSPSDLKGLLDDLLSDAEEARYAQAVAASLAQTVLDASTTYCRRAPGSRNGRRGPCRGHEDYLASGPVYRPSRFRQVFCIPLSTYRVLHDERVDEELNRNQNVNGVGPKGHTPNQKMLCTLCKLATALSYAQQDDMARMCSKAQRDATKLTLHATYRRFGPVYLNREPTLVELSRTSAMYTDQGISGCIGAVDCMHLYCENCTRDLKEQFHNLKTEN